VYEGQQESYYFQAEPPGQFGVQRDLDRPPVSCLLSPIYPGQSLQIPLRLLWPYCQAMTDARLLAELQSCLASAEWFQLRCQSFVSGSLLAWSAPAFVFHFITKPMPQLQFVKLFIGRRIRLSKLKFSWRFAGRLLHHRTLVSVAVLLPQRRRR